MFYLLQKLTPFLKNITTVLLKLIIDILTPLYSFKKSTNCFYLHCSPNFNVLRIGVFVQRSSKTILEIIIVVGIFVKIEISDVL